MDYKIKPNEIALQADNAYDILNSMQNRALQIGAPELLDQQSQDWLYQTPEKQIATLQQDIDKLQKEKEEESNAYWRVKNRLKKEQELKKEVKEGLEERLNRRLTHRDFDYPFDLIADDLAIIKLLEKFD